MNPHFWDNLLTILILGALMIIAYCKWTNRTLGEVIKDLRESMADNVEGG